MSHISMKKLIIIVMGLIIAILPFVLTISASSTDFIPITIDNATELQILTTIENYHETNNFCACDIRVFSDNGQTVATDWKVHDLVSGKTLNLEGTGYPLALSPDGAKVVVSGNNTGTRIIEINSGNETTIMSEDTEVSAFSPDGELIITSSRDADAVQVWQTSELTLVTTLGRSTSFISNNEPQFTSDGRYLIWADQNQNLHVSNILEDFVSWQIAENVWRYELMPDQQSIVLNKSDFETVEVWDISTQERLASIVDTREQSGVENYALSADRQTLAIKYFGGNERLELWDISVEPFEKITEITDRAGSMLNFTSDNQYLIYSGGFQKTSCDRESLGCGSRSGTSSDNIRILNIESGEFVSTATPPDNSSIGNTEFIADENLIITSGTYWNNIVHLWRLEGSEISFITSYPGREAMLSPDGSTLLVELNENFLAIFGIPSAERSVQSYITSGNIVPSSINVRSEPSIDSDIVGIVSDTVRILGRSPAGDYYYLPDYDGWVRSEPSYVQLISDLPIESIQIIDLESLQLPTAPLQTNTPNTTPTLDEEEPIILEELRLPVGDPVIDPNQSPLELPPINPQNAEQVSLLGVLPQSSITTDNLPMVVPYISADGTRLITPPTGDTQQPRLWDLINFDYENSANVGESTFSLIFAASPDGKTIAYTPDKFYQPLQLWSADTQSSKSLFPVRSFYNVSLLFSPDGNSLAYSDGVYDVLSDQIRFTLDNSGSLAFSPDSTHLAIIDRKRAYIYDAQSGDLLSRTPRTEPRNMLYAGKLSPDNSVLAVTSSEGIIVYNVTDGEILYNLQSENYFKNWQIENVVFSPDATTMVALNPDGELHVLDLQNEISIGYFDTEGATGIAFSPDGQLLAIGNPLRLVNLSNGYVTVVEGNYGGDQILFSPDGSSLLVNNKSRYYGESSSVMVFGIPINERPSWSAIPARIRPSGINIRLEPDGNSSIIGTVSGDITIIARDENNQAVFLAEPEGWIWSSPEYLDIDEALLELLPVRVSQSQ